MKPTIALAAAAFAHAMLIGLLTGLSMSPIVGVLLPLLLGAGGYRLVDSITGSSTPDTNGILMRVPSGVGWMVALWCAVVVASVFTGIGLRDGAFRLGPRPATTLSLMRLDQQPSVRVPDLTLICDYYDRLGLSPDQRRAVATALSDTTLDTGTILTTLREYFSEGASASKATPATHGVYEFGRGSARP